MLASLPGERACALLGPEVPLRPALLAIPLLCACPMQVDDPGASSPGPGPSAGPASSLEAPPEGGAPMPGGEGGAIPGASPAPGSASEGQTPSGPSPSDGVPIRLDVQPPREDDPKWTQQALAKADHVTFSGTVRCEGCVAPLVLRALPFQPPDELTLGRPPSPLTVLPIAEPHPVEPRAFSLLVPRGDDPLVLELLVDLDADGSPDRGERMSVVVRDGQLVPNQDREGLTIDATDSGTGPWPSMAPDKAGGGG